MRLWKDGGAMKPATRELIQKDQVLALIRSAQAGTHSLKARRSGLRELYEAVKDLPPATDPNWMDARISPPPDEAVRYLTRHSQVVRGYWSRSRRRYIGLCNNVLMDVTAWYSAPAPYPYRR